MTSHYSPPLWLCRDFCDEILNGAEFRKTKVVSFGFFCNFQHHAHAQFCILNSGYFCPISTRREFGGQYVLAQIPHIKFHENSPSVSPFVVCGRTDGRTAVMRLTVAFRKFVKAPAENCAQAAPPNAHYKHSKLLEWRLTAVGACVAVREGNYHVRGHRK